MTAALWDRTDWSPPKLQRIPLPFPRIIHMMWVPSLDGIPEEIRSYPDQWKEMNPGWQLMLWDEPRLIQMLRGFAPDMIPLYRGAKLPIKQADFGRLAVLLKYGGLYIDMDMEPQRPLDCFFSEPYIIAHRSHHTRSIPRHVTKHPVDWEKCDMIMSREYRKIDQFTGLANGAMFSVPENPLLGQFLYEHAPNTNEKVLDYLGPHALTRFLRKNMNPSRLVVLPPYYFLWESQAFDHEAPDWVICKHLGKSNWANPWNKDNPFDVK